MSTDVLGSAIYYGLFDEAERVRWKLSEVPWHELDRAAVSPGLVRLVREIALSELTTFSATRRFFAEFADDIDFTQWLAVWLYEETKHPQVLMQWLSRFGVTVDETAFLRARATAPFMKSRMGTLVMNVVSEMIASARYLGLARHAKEPVLRWIGRALAADEARHATSFAAYARQQLARSVEPELDRLNAIKVLHFWLCEGDKVQHPVHLLYEHAANAPELAPVLAELPVETEKLEARVCTVVGNLIERRIEGRAAIDGVLRELVAATRREGAQVRERS